MPATKLHVVTGAFGFSGKCIAGRLLDKGIRVRTLTGRRPTFSPLWDAIETVPFNFHKPARLTDSLRGADVLYNTYWVRFPKDNANHDTAVENTRTLIRCAADAGVSRFVHVSITNPSEDSELSYFRGKAVLERELRDSGLSYAILRPAVLFGHGDVLLNNIAWMLRKLPVFGVFGRGDYRLQPVHVDDLAALAVQLAERRDNVILDAVGPETFSYRELVRLISKHIDSNTRIIHVRPTTGLMIGSVLGRFLGDVLITRDEIRGLMANLLVSKEPPTCSTRFSAWLAENAEELGRRYASEVARHYG